MINVRSNIMLQKWKSLTEQEKVLYCSICGVLIVIAIVAVLLFIKGSDYRSDFAKNETTIESLTKELAILESTSVLGKDEATDNLMSCATAGKAIAAYQNAYANAKTEDESNAIANSISEYITNAVRQTRWYYGEAPYEWTFHSTYSFKENEIEVLWTCKNIDTGELLAYTTGYYDAISQKFHTLTCNFTSIGASTIGAD